MRRPHMPVTANRSRDSGSMNVFYDYIGCTLGQGRAGWTKFQSSLNGAFRSTLRASGGELLGLFAPQLGFASNEATLLLRWRNDSDADQFQIPADTGGILRTRDRLVATARPHSGQQLELGGIYVHRWFTIDADRIADFVDLSQRAWTQFEDSYDTKIFGLFEAATDAAERHEGTARLFLLTRYRDHSAWEASRTQTQDARGIFAQRHLLTRSTIGRSSVLVRPV